MGSNYERAHIRPSFLGQWVGSLKLIWIIDPIWVISQLCIKLLEIQYSHRKEDVDPSTLLKLLAIRTINMKEPL